MKAMLLQELAPFKENPSPLSLTEVPEPVPNQDQVLIKISACGVCHTELDEIEGRTAPPELPIILGHQVVGTVETGPNQGQRVGVAWIYSACGSCEFCKAGQENLCEQFQATGRDVNGGYAQYMTVSADFTHPIPDSLSDFEAAPLLCAGAIGYRSLRLTNLRNGGSLGLTGFGGSNHLVLKLVKHLYPNSKIYVFTRNPKEQEFARSLGADWAGAIESNSPSKLDAIIDTTPVWKSIVEGLSNLKNGGRLVINAIRKEDLDKQYLLKLEYPAHLWMEKEIKSVANVTREDVRDFLNLAAAAGIKPEIQEYDLENANQALLELKSGKIRGAKVLRI